MVSPNHQNGDLNESLEDYDNDFNELGSFSTRRHEPFSQFHYDHYSHRHNTDSRIELPSFGTADLRYTRRKIKSTDYTTGPQFSDLDESSSVNRLRGKRGSEKLRRLNSMAVQSSYSDRIHYLPRGGTVVMTEIGAIQFGIPPETIKDCLSLNLEVPQFYVVPQERFCSKLGPEQGLNLAEFEFPAYFNFFMKQGRKIVLVVDNENVKNCIQQVFQETLIGPKQWDPNVDFTNSYPVEKKPMLMKEMGYFQYFGSHKLTVDLLLQFSVFGSSHEVILKHPEDSSKFVSIFRTLDEYVLFDSNRNQICSVPSEIKIPTGNIFLPPLSLSRATKRLVQKNKPIGFTPPAFGVTVLGSSHGFDPSGRTSGYVLWINHRGLMIDPPPNSTTLLQKNFIPACLIDAVIVTHCHADHDAGTFQKILQEGKVTLITTPTIMGCFLRKYSALAGFEREFLKTVFKFKPAKIGEKMNFHGGKLNFFYTLHSIPCVGFEAYYGGKSIVFSADHMNDPVKINRLFEEGILTKGRRDDLLNFPWHHDLILHEAGVPPIHTPIETLLGLDESVKKKLFLVHVSLSSIPKDSGLKAAKSGVENTIVVENVIPPTYSEQLLKIDLVTGIEMFSDLKLRHAGEIFTSAEVVQFKAGEYMFRKGDPADSFYIIQSGIAEVKLERTRSLGNFEDDDENQDCFTTDSAESEHELDDSVPRRNSRYRLRASSESELVDPIDSMDGTEVQLSGLRKSGSLTFPPTSLEIPPISTIKRSNRKKWSVPKRKSKSYMSSFRGDAVELSMKSGYFTMRTFYPGDYFGEQALISDFCVRSVSIAAVADVTAIRFEKQSFLAILEDTDILRRLKHLATMRERGTLDTIENNSMLRLLSPNQKTQLETYFVRKKFKNGQVIWKENDPCEFALLVHHGHLTYSQSATFYKRRGSGVHCDMSVLYNEIRGDNTFSSSSTRTHHSKTTVLPDIHAKPAASSTSEPHSVSGEDTWNYPPLNSDQQSHLVNGNTYSGSYKHIHENSAYEESPPETDNHRQQQYDLLQNSFIFKRGAFVGDVDGLFYNGCNRVGLKALGDVTVLCLKQADLQKFFKNNPGVLLSMLHTQFIV